MACLISLLTCCKVYQQKPISLYKSLTPNQFLEHLKRNADQICFTYETAPIDWIDKNDIDTLITRIYDTTPIPSIVHPLSSYLPNEQSCIGREAQNMIQAYIKKEGYLNSLYSFGPVDTINAKSLVIWYRNR